MRFTAFLHCSDVIVRNNWGKHQNCVAKTANVCLKRKCWKKRKLLKDSKRKKKYLNTAHQMLGLQLQLLVIKTIKWTKYLIKDFSLRKNSPQNIVRNLRSVPVLVLYVCLYTVYTVWKAKTTSSALNTKWIVITAFAVCIWTLQKNVNTFDCLYSKSHIQMTMTNACGVTK